MAAAKVAKRVAPPSEMPSIARKSRSACGDAFGVATRAAARGAYVSASPRRVVVRDVRNAGISLRSADENGRTATRGALGTRRAALLSRSSADIASCTVVALSERRNIAPNFPGNAVGIANDADAAALETIGTGKVLVAITRRRSISSSSNS